VIYCQKGGSVRPGEHLRGVHRREAGFCLQTLRTPCWNWLWDVFIAALAPEQVSQQHSLLRAGENPPQQHRWRSGSGSGSGGAMGSSRQPAAVPGGLLKAATAPNLVLQTASETLSRITFLNRFKLPVPLSSLASWQPRVLEGHSEGRKCLSPPCPRWLGEL